MRDSQLDNYLSRAQMQGKRYVFFPIHMPFHWVLVSYRLDTGLCEYFDSLITCGETRLHVGRAQRVLRFCNRVMGRDESFGEACAHPQTPQQHWRGGPGVDCGVFVCAFMLMICQDTSVSRMSQHVASDFRKHIAVSIHSNKLIGD